MGLESSTQRWSRIPGSEGLAKGETRAKTGHWGMPLIGEGEEAEMESGELISTTAGGEVLRQDSWEEV